MTYARFAARQPRADAHDCTRALRNIRNRFDKIRAAFVTAAGGEDECVFS
jgi:hypothetical protein